MSNIAYELGLKLKQLNLVLVTAESCTGGWVSKLVTDVPGSSAWFDRGFITYSNNAKSEMLSVDRNIINEFGAVSEQTVLAMAQGALVNSNAGIAIATSGIAGPDGGTLEKPVGLVCFSWLKNQEFQITESKMFTGDRDQIRLKASNYVLENLNALLVQSSKSS